MKTEDRAKEIQSMYIQLFSTDLGKVVLSHLESTFLDSDHIAPDSDLYRIGVRDGRRNVIYQIKQQLKGLR